jgi:hypothetical protein
MIVTALCVTLLVVVSLLTPRPAPAKLVNTTVHCLWDGDTAQPAVPWYKNYRLWLSLVCGGTALMWYWMR